MLNFSLMPAKKQARKNHKTNKVTGINVFFATAFALIVSFTPDQSMAGGGPGHTKTKTKMQKPSSQTSAPRRPAAPAQRPAAPVQRPAAPAQRPAAPVQRQAAPVQRPAAPVQRPAAPVQRPAAPVQRQAAPVQRPAAPVQRPAAPAQRQAAPAQRQAAPVQRQAAPAQRQAAPVQRPAAPAQPTAASPGNVSLSTTPIISQQGIDYPYNGCFAASVIQTLYRLDPEVKVALAQANNAPNSINDKFKQLMLHIGGLGNQSDTPRLVGDIMRQITGVGRPDDSAAFADQLLNRMRSDAPHVKRTLKAYINHGTHPAWHDTLPLRRDAATKLHEAAREHMLEGLDPATRANLENMIAIRRAGEDNTPEIEVLRELIGNAAFQRKLNDAYTAISQNYPLNEFQDLIDAAYDEDAFPLEGYPNTQKNVIMNIEQVGEGVGDNNQFVRNAHTATNRYANDIIDDVTLLMRERHSRQTYLLTLRPVAKVVHNIAHSGGRLAYGTGGHYITYQRADNSDTNLWVKCDGLAISNHHQPLDHWFTQAQGTGCNHQTVLIVFKVIDRTEQDVPDGTQQANAANTAPDNTQRPAPITPPNQQGMISNVMNANAGLTDQAAFERAIEESRAEAEQRLLTLLSSQSTNNAAPPPNTSTPDPLPPADVTDVPQDFLNKLNALIGRSNGNLGYTPVRDLESMADDAKDPISLQVLKSYGQNQIFQYRKMNRGPNDNAFKYIAIDSLHSLWNRSRVYNSHRGAWSAKKFQCPQTRQDIFRINRRNEFVMIP